MYLDQQFSQTHEKTKPKGENPSPESTMEDTTDNQIDRPPTTINYQQENNGFTSTVSRRFWKQQRASAMAE